MRVRKLEFALRKFPPWVLVGASWLALALVAWADHVSGQDLQLEFFYLLPLAVVSWLCGRREGLVAAGLATVLWTLVDVTGRPVRSQPALIVWIAEVELLIFSGLAYMLSLLARMVVIIRHL